MIGVATAYKYAISDLRSHNITETDQKQACGEPTIPVPTNGRVGTTSENDGVAIAQGDHVDRQWRCISDEGRNEWCLQGRTANRSIGNAGRYHAQRLEGFSNCVETVTWQDLHLIPGNSSTHKTAAARA
jgi:hypothetical protein